MKKIIVCFCIIFCSVASFAHTSKNQFHITGQIVSPMSLYAGVDLAVGQYQSIGYWNAGVSLVDRQAVSRTGSKFSYAHTVVNGEYMFRIYGTRSRMFSFYGGAGAFLGCEINDPFRRLPAGEYITSGDGQARNINFLYGVSLRVEGEVFVAKDIAMILSVRMPVNISSSYRHCLFEVGVGVRYNF